MVMAIFSSVLGYSSFIFAFSFRFTFRFVASLYIVI